MATQTLIRLKRSLEESPVDTLILNCKKRKLDSEPESDHCISTLLKFTGTQNSQEEVIEEGLTVPKGDLKSKYSNDLKKYNVDINKKRREEAKEISKHNRYKVINCLRSNNEAYNMAIYDIELEKCDTKPKSDKFVFDLYYTETTILDEVESYNVSICPTSEDLVFDSEEVYNIDEENDSEDSNAEGNWRNDYPDESDGSINEDDIVNAVKNVKLEDELSSDDGDYYGESDNEKYGKLYAKFKAKNKNDSDLQEDQTSSESECSF